MVNKSKSIKNPISDETIDVSNDHDGSIQNTKAEQATKGEENKGTHNETSEKLKDSNIIAGTKKNL